MSRLCHWTALAALLAPTFFCALFFRRPADVWRATILSDLLLVAVARISPLHEIFVKANPYAPSLACAGLQHSRVVATLKQLSYRFVSFASDYEPSECADTADVYLSPFAATETAPNAFHGLLMDKTPLGFLTEATQNAAYARRRKCIRYVLETLGKTVRGESPKFVLAHVLSPHPPFLFGENG